jgi:uncharacterized protein DUF3592
MKNVLFGLIFAAVGIGVCGFGYVTLTKAKASADWPSIQGAVTSSDVETRRETTGTGSEARTKIKYAPIVHYSYEVDGREHAASRISYGGFTSSSSRSARRVVNRYPVGAEVAIYYDPGDPGTAVLEPGASWTIYLLFPFGGIFALVGVAVMFGKSRPNGLRSSPNSLRQREGQGTPAQGLSEHDENGEDDAQQIEY